jgi:hypothetical protein
LSWCPESNNAIIHIHLSYTEERKKKRKENSRMGGGGYKLVGREGERKEIEGEKRNLSSKARK